MLNVEVVERAQEAEREGKFLVCTLKQLPQIVDNQLPEKIEIYSVDKSKAVGRSQDNDIVATSHAISHYHMVLEVQQTRPKSGYAPMPPLFLDYSASSSSNAAATQSLGRNNTLKRTHSEMLNNGPMSEDQGSTPEEPMEHLNNRNVRRRGENGNAVAGAAAAPAAAANNRNRRNSQQNAAADRTENIGNAIEDSNTLRGRGTTAFGGSSSSTAKMNTNPEIDKIVRGVSRNDPKVLQVLESLKSIGVDVNKFTQEIKGTSTIGGPPKGVLKVNASTSSGPGSFGRDSLVQYENVNTWLLREKMRNNVHVFLRDVSTYGTYVNGVKVGRNVLPRLLRHGDVIAFMRHEEEPNVLGDFRVEYAEGHAPRGDEVVSVELPLFTSMSFGDWIRHREAVVLANSSKSTIRQCYRVCLTTFLMCNEDPSRKSRIKADLPQDIRRKILEFLYVDTPAQAVAGCPFPEEQRPPKADHLKHKANKAKERHINSTVETILNYCDGLASNGTMQLEMKIYLDNIENKANNPKWMWDLKGEVLKDRRLHTKIKDLGYIVEHNNQQQKLTIKWSGQEAGANNRAGAAAAAGAALAAAAAAADLGAPPPPAVLERALGGVHRRLGIRAAAAAPPPVNPDDM
ncbi:unnamed protein product [Amoebophrya sp. A120]|nr:unnamed protein product [Amoebophrya sp. A120]|eukprot:GSA120T00017280001.1